MLQAPNTKHAPPWLSASPTHLKPCLYALGVFFAVGLFDGEAEWRPPRHRLVQRSHNLLQDGQHTDLPSLTACVYQILEDASWE